MKSESTAINQRVLTPKPTDWANVRQWLTAYRAQQPRKTRTLLKAAVALALFAVSSHAADWTKIRRIAQVAGCAASMVDAGTTLRPGIIETNPMLGHGRPQAGRIIGIKLGMCAGQIAYSEWRHARYGAAGERVATFAGFGQATFYGAVSAHNLGIQGAK